MEAKNFRIGNWVNGEYRGFSNDVQIYGMDKKVIQHSHESVQPLPTEHFNPIPLNEEWLVKFGFNKGEESYLWERTGNGFTIEFETGNGVVGCYLERVELDVIYVHELQNLFFALTGTELELKNES